MFSTLYLALSSQPRFHTPLVHPIRSATLPLPIPTFAPLPWHLSICLCSLWLGRLPAAVANLRPALLAFIHLALFPLALSVAFSFPPHHPHELPFTMSAAILFVSSFPSTPPLPSSSTPPHHLPTQSSSPTPFTTLTNYPLR